MKGCLKAVFYFIIVSICVFGSIIVITKLTEKPKTNEEINIENKKKIKFKCEYFFTETIQRSCKDPNSFKEISTSSDTIDNGKIRVSVTYSATNSFGGRIQDTKKALFSKEGEFIKIIE